MPSARNILGLALGLVQNPNEHPTLIKLILLCSKLINNKMRATIIGSELKY